MLPGETRNPAGSSAKARALGKIRRLTADQLAEVTSLLLTSTKAEIQAMVKDEDASFLQVWTAKLLASSHNKGDVAVYRAILDRVVGRPKETVSIGGDANNGPVRVDYRTREEKLERLAVLQAARKQTEDYDPAPSRTDEIGKAEGVDAPGGVGDHGSTDALPGTE